ncbi:TonB-dependent receptor [Thalassotalea sediminis]|uniref:TonB-dependent receptor n=1 Tax=Thalassotalea sediminis TaxID=1759089 RepID=UPI002573AFAB|nr:TonB-dependent receptor [Thalassotalea sediminis]
MLFSQITRKEKKTVRSQLLIRLHSLVISAWFIFPLLCNAQSAELYLFNIPAQSADQALSQFGQQTQQTLLYSYELTKSRTTNAVQGYYTQQQALRIMLRETGLGAKVTEKGEISVITRLNDDIHQANITKSKRVQTTEEQQPLSIEKISVIGSRTFSRTINDLSIPVDILTNRTLIETGETELGRMIQKLAPSFNFSSSSISDGTDVLKPATLRGLGPDQTLILINGKRRHNASLIHINTSVGRGATGADINAIPVNAIDRVEILRDGAAAQYGSDAIAGVINIVLKSGNQKNNITTSLGQYSRSDGETAKASVNYHHDIGNEGFLNTTLTTMHHNSTDRSGLHGTCQYSTCKMTKDGLYQTNDPREISANRKTFNIGDPKSQQFAVALNSAVPLGQGKLYSFAIFSKRHNNASAFFRQANNQPANPLLSDGEATIKNGYLPIIHSDITDKSFTLGYNGTAFNKLLYDISYSYGKNTIDYETRNAINASFVASIKDLKPASVIRRTVPRNADAYGLALALQTINIDLTRQFDHFDFAVGLELRKDHYQVTAGEKYSYYDYHKNDAEYVRLVKALPGIQGFPGIAPEDTVNEQRDVLSLYAEVGTQITPSFDLTGALRFDDYDGVQDTSNIKVAAKWQLNQLLSFRGSISTGFRAPSMQQLYFNNTSTQFVVENEQHLVAEQIGTFRNDSVLAKSIGIPPLIEEKSTNLSLGGVFDKDNLTVTIDYYAINIDDRIVISNQLSSTFSPTLAQTLANAHVDKAQVFLNAADTKTKGIDFIASYNTSLTVGELDLIIAANVTNTEVSKLYSPKNSELHKLSVNEVFSQQDISIIEEWQPEDRISVMANFQRDNLKVNLAINRYGSYTITDGSRQKFGAEWLTDINIERKITPALSIVIGVNNVFDEMPDQNTIGNSHAGTIVDEENNVIVESSGVFKYSRRSAPFGFNGKYYYAKLQYNF